MYWSEPKCCSVIYIVEQGLINKIKQGYGKFLKSCKTGHKWILLSKNNFCLHIDYWKQGGCTYEHSAIVTAYTRLLYTQTRQNSSLEHDNWNTSHLCQTEEEVLVFEELIILNLWSLADWSHSRPAYTPKNNLATITGQDGLKL